ncbi:TetR family transcriptional regulator [Actinospica sp. MGRD01-02]|uniref:TetR family transcriptional regulator n=1 Tax=Actinospica acidithermotolerans TaxID=2828514 RepID=A0A941IHE0_9ACTN|nr:TetR family transcriptional regulator [Actinospica acidithermotolerans]MBR7825088.1 TetR family transcriptional regulator [Actinospica acidithermotolerans]
MGRWEPDTRGRLERAAIELYLEQGFDQTTVAQITHRAGLTTRTFFRHFADKRDVLFAGRRELSERVAKTIAAAPPAWSAARAGASGLNIAAAALQLRREEAKDRRALIRSTPELRERELLGYAEMAETVAEALTDRGLEQRAARVTATALLAAFQVAFEYWGDHPDRELPQLVNETLDELKSIAGSDF